MADNETSHLEAIETERAIATHLRKELLNVSAIKDQLQNASIQLDTQCEQLHDLLQKTKAERDLNAKNCLNLEQQIADLHAQLATANDHDQTLQTITRERDRLIDKVAYLTVSIFIMLDNEI